MLKGKRIPRRSIYAQNMSKVVPSYTINMKTGEVTSKLTIGGPRRDKSGMVTKAK